MNAKLQVVQGRPEGKSLLFPVGEYVFGRGPECHVRPNSEWVSRQHCILRVTSGGIFIRDLGSRNGTLVNGTRVIGERQLASGDQVQVGPLVFSVGFDLGPQAEIGTVVPPTPRTVDENEKKPDSTDELTHLSDGEIPAVSHRNPSGDTFQV